MKKSVYSCIQQDYLAPRVWTNSSRRFRGHSPELDVVVEEEVKPLEAEEVVTEKMGRKDEETEKRERVEVEEDSEQEEDGEGEKEEEGDEGKGTSLIPRIYTVSGVDVVRIKTSILGERSHDLMCHKNSYSDYFMSSHSSSSSSCNNSVEHDFNEAAGNGSSVHSTKGPLPFGNVREEGREKLVSGSIWHTVEEMDESTETHSLEEQTYDYLPHLQCGVDSPSGSHEGANSNGSSSAVSPP